MIIYSLYKLINWKKRNMERKEKKALRVDLNNSLSKDLEDIKKYFGIMSDSDMIRFLIREKKKEIIQEDVYTLLDKHEKQE